MTVFVLILLLIGIIGVIGYTSHLNDEHKKTPWKEFAKANDLTYTPGKLLSSSYVSGDYGGYYLELESFLENRQTFTRLTLYTDYKRHRDLALDSKSEPGKLKNVDIIKILAPDGLPNSVEIMAQGDSFAFKEQGVITDRHHLETISTLLSNIATGYPKVLALEGEAGPALELIAAVNHGLRSVAVELIKDISRVTTGRLGHRASNLVCPNCFTRCSAHKIPLELWELDSYYGCRNCHQSREFIELAGPIVAVLDNQAADIQAQQDQMVRVNWINYRRLFDFDEVQIIRATDEEVERLAVQIGNDTDPVRQPRYRQMHCTIAPDCHLSENTLRILQQMFGQVLRQPVGPTI